MSGLLLRFCFVCNTHAEQGRHQHGGKIRLNQERTVKRLTPLPFFIAALQRGNKISRTSHV